MSLPVQLPLLNTNQAAPAPASSRVNAVEPSDPLKPKGEDDFDKAMQAADENQKQESNSEVQAAKKPQEKSDAADDEGKDLPPQVVGNETGQKLEGTDTVFFVDETLKLQLGLDQFDTLHQVDDAVLLAAGFVVDSLPTSVREAATEVSLSGNLETGKPELLTRLQLQLNQGQAGQNPIQLNLDSVALGSLKELTQVKDKQSTAISSVASVDAAASQATAAGELRAAALGARPELVVPNRVGSEGWNEAMAGRISLLVNQRISSARIHINPPELGPIEVRVNVNHDQASVQFTSQSAQVRDALEQSIPRLRDMLETAGFSLADSDVNDQSGSGGQEGEAEEVAEASNESQSEPPRRESLGLVDHYV